MMRFSRQRKKIILFSLLILPALPFKILAQDSWSLRDCIRYAYENNIQIKQQLLNADMNENNLFQSKMDLLPNLNAGGNFGQSFGRAIDPATNIFVEERYKSTNFSINSSVTLFDGLQKYNTIQQNRLNLLASIQDVEKLKNDIAILIAGAYLQILLEKELLEVAESQLEITNQQVERTRRLVEAGSLAQGALLEIQSQAAAEELNVISAESSIDISYLTLTQLLDLDSIGGFTIEVPDLEDVGDQVLSMTITSVYNEAVNILPQVKSAEYQLESARKNLNLALGSRSPRLTLSGSYGSLYSDIRIDPQNPTGDYPFWAQMQDNANANISLGLQIPIFNGWMVNNYISNARLGVMNSRLQLESTENLLFKDIQKAYYDALAAQKAYNATEKALVSMQESFRYTEQKFEVGLVNAVDYNSEKTRLTRTQSELLQAKYDFVFKTKILDFYRGSPLTLGPTE